jgi:hypothetical protein
VNDEELGTSIYDKSKDALVVSIPFIFEKYSSWGVSLLSGAI